MDRSFYHFVTIHACDRRTDGQTDRILIARPHLHSMQRGKKHNINLILCRKFQFYSLLINSNIKVYSVVNCFGAFMSLNPKT